MDVQLGSNTSFEPTVLRDAQGHFERAKSLDPDGLVPQIFLQQVWLHFEFADDEIKEKVQISFLSTSSKTSEHDSDEEETTLDPTGNPNKRVKR